MFSPVRCERQPHPGPGGELAHGNGVYSQLLHGLLQGRTHRRPFYVPVQERTDSKLLPSQCPYDAEGISDGLQLRGDKAHR